MLPFPDNDPPKDRPNTPPPIWDLKPGWQVRDPDGAIWVVQGNRKKGKKYLDCRLGIRKKGTNVYREIPAKELLNGWLFIWDKAPDQVITLNP